MYTVAELHLAGRSTTLAQALAPPCLALPSPAYCCASVIVWTENKNVTISDRFICFVLTVKRRWRPAFWGRQLKKVVNFFEEKSGWPGWRILWHRNDLAPLMRWRRHCTYNDLRVTNWVNRQLGEYSAQMLKPLLYTSPWKWRCRSSEWSCNGQLEILLTCSFNSGKKS